MPVVMIRRLGSMIGRRLGRFRSCLGMMMVSFRLILPPKCCLVALMITPSGLGIFRKWSRESIRGILCCFRMWSLKSFKSITMLSLKIRRRNSQQRKNRKNKLSLKSRKSLHKSLRKSQFKSQPDL